MVKLIEFISSFKELNWKEIIFRNLNYLPFLAGALVLILLLKWLINLKSKRRPSLGVSSLAFFERERFLRKIWREIPEIVALLGVAYLILSLLNPVQPLIKNEKSIETKEIMIILDFSETMTHGWGGYYATGESEETKLDIEQKYVIKFIESRKDDRIGLIVYSTNAYLTSPFTQDHKHLISLIKLFEIRQGDIGGWKNIIPGEIYTATGEALFLTNEYFNRYGKSKEKIIVLFTDGDTNEGREPVEALEELKKSGGFKVFLLGIGYQGRYEELVNDVQTIIGGKDFKVDTEEDFRKAVSFVDKQTGKNRMIVDEYIVDEPKYFYFAFIALVLFILALFLKHLHYFRDLL